MEYPIFMLRTMLDLLKGKKVSGAKLECARVILRNLVDSFDEASKGHFVFSPPAVDGNLSTGNSNVISTLDIEAKRAKDELTQDFSPV